MHTFQEAARLDPRRVGEEAARLASQAARLAPGFVLNAEYEENFYRMNNLPEQLRTLFAPINPRRVDEDALEALTEAAQRLLRNSYLLDDEVQLFYRALRAAGLLDRAVHLRRDGDTHAESTALPPPGSDGLLALKKLWARDWSFDAVLGRLDEHGSIGLEARPVLLFAGRPGRGDPALAAQLGWPRALTNDVGLVGA